MNWIVNILNYALSVWSDKFTEILQLVSMSPQTFKGGTVWSVIINIHNGLQAIAYGLLVLFFAMGIFKQAASFREVRRPEQALRFFIRFLMAKVAISYGLEIMTTIFEICGGVISKVGESLATVSSNTAVPQNIADAISKTNIISGIGLFFVSVIGVLAVFILSFMMILTVYGRFFRLYMYTAIAPIPLSTFGGEGFSSTGKAFVKSYVGVCLEGAIVVLACIIYSAFAGSGSLALGAGGTDATTMAWAYLSETVFGMLVLVLLIKGADKIVKEMLAL